MNEELWASVERKMRGYLEAAKQLGVPCSVCGEMLDPQDTGVNTETGIRFWITDCCGIKEMYEEKVDLGFDGLQADN